MIIRKYYRNRDSVGLTIPKEYVIKYNLRAKDYVVFIETGNGDLLLRFLTQEELNKLLLSRKEA